MSQVTITCHNKFVSFLISIITSLKKCHNNVKVTISTFPIAVNDVTCHGHNVCYECIYKKLSVIHINYIKERCNYSQ